MTIHGIDHVEWYVGDARQTAYLLCTAYGFRIVGQGGPETGLGNQRSLLLAQGDIHMVLTTALNSAHPAAHYVARHGDGIAVIAFACDDAADLFDETVRRGATPITAPLEYSGGESTVTMATVSGVGDVVHRLVTRRGRIGQFLPGAFDMIALDPEDPDTLLQVIDHAAMCVSAGELDATIRYYEEVFGFRETFQEYIEVDGQGMVSKVVQSPSEMITFTLMEPDLTRRPGQIDDFLQWHAGPGIQHLAFRTPDIVTAVRTFSDRGVAFALTPRSYYEGLDEKVGPLERPLEDIRELGVLVDSDHWGRMYQIFTQSMHVRRTLFLELIERHGALTFGTNNIKALYEAKERELGRSATFAATA
ncbi:MAG TPA: 4-hydroxyphenylpyruvate dioxygenase [Micromonosporaceae bacterium]|jgi:4-hydroxymandelate synthase